MQTGWNVVNCSYSACFLLLWREKNVSCFFGHFGCRCCQGEYRRSSTGDAFFCVQLLLKRGATTSSALNTLKTKHQTLAREDGTRDSRRLVRPKDSSLQNRSLYLDRHTPVRKGRSTTLLQVQKKAAVPKTSIAITGILHSAAFIQEDTADQDRIAFSYTSGNMTAQHQPERDEGFEDDREK